MWDVNPFFLVKKYQFYICVEYMVKKLQFCVSTQFNAEHLSIT